MKKDTLKQYGFLLSSVGSVVFILLTIIAMFTYTGGSKFFPDAQGYAFLQNFISDLGMRTSFSGESNIISSVLFSIACVIMGISMIPYFLYFPSFFQSKKGIHLLAWLGSLLGFISAVAYIGIGFTPWDIMMKAHLFFVYLAFPMTLPVIIFYIICTFSSKNVSNIISYVYLVLALILGGYLYLLFWGPSSSTETGRFIQVVGQKIIVYAEVVVFLIQGIITSRLSVDRNKVESIARSIT